MKLQRKESMVLEQYPKIDSRIKASVVDLAVTPEGSPEKGHLSQRLISR